MSNETNRELLDEERMLASHQEQKFMKTTVGLWIDRRKAVIVFVTGRDEEIKLIYSNVEKRHSQSGVSAPADDIQQRELTEYLNSYYDEVISSLWNSGAILIMGPGEAKGELKKRLEIDNPNGRIVDVETTDKMTDCQIVAKAREHSLKQGSAAGSR
jgi:stalled ribosome rescue protein Dom34